MKAGVKRDLQGGMDDAGDTAWTFDFDCEFTTEGFEDEDRLRVMLVEAIELADRA